MTVHIGSDQDEINQQDRETITLCIRLLEELKLRKPGLLRDFSQNIQSLLSDELILPERLSDELIQSENVGNPTLKARIANDGIPMTRLDAQIDDMVKNGIHSIMPEYVYYQDRTKLDFAPDGTKRSRRKKDNAMEHLERYFAHYLRYFTPLLIEQDEEPLYMFQLRHIDSNLARALIDFSIRYPQALESTSIVIPSKYQSGTAKLAKMATMNTSLLTVKGYWANRTLSKIRQTKDKSS